MLVDISAPITAQSVANLQVNSNLAFYIEILNDKDTSFKMDNFYRLKYSFFGGTLEIVSNAFNGKIIQITCNKGYSGKYYNVGIGSTFKGLFESHPHFNELAYWGVISEQERGIMFNFEYPKDLDEITTVESEVVSSISIYPEYLYYLFYETNVFPDLKHPIF